MLEIYCASCLISFIILFAVMELCKDKLNQLGDVTKKSSTAAAVSQRIFVSLIPVLRELLIIFCIVIMLLNDRQIEKIKSNKKQ